MKNIYILLGLFFFMNVFSQYNRNSPWKVNETSKSKTQISFDEEVKSFEDYWIDKDFAAKGSGYKPFKRWEYFWQNQLNSDGKIMLPEQLWSIWKQKNEIKTNNKAVLSLPVSNWTPVGPFTHTNTGSWSSGQGRVQVVCVDPSNANTIYVGSPAGGIWKSTNAGANWTPLSDNLPQIGISGIAVDYSNPNIIYIATGDKDSSDTYSVGVLKSIDGGLTWNTTGLTFFDENTLAGDLIINPTNNQVLFCATSNGLYKTINGGATWIFSKAGDFSQGSLRFKPNNPNTIYATTYDTFFKSTDSGANFIAVNTGLPSGSSRLLLDVTNADSNYVYILSAIPPTTMPTNYGFNGIYLSTNSGASFTRTAQTSDILESRQSYYDLALAVSQTNKNTIFTGCLNVWKSTNTGTSFTRLNNWSNPTGASYTHGDIHYIKAFGNKTFVCSDGGIYVSDNDGLTFTSKTAGLQISQFYKIAVSKQTASNMVGGLQDNGGYAYSGGMWKNYYGADGMDAAIDPLNSNKYYGFIQSGGSLYISNSAGNSNDSGVAKPFGETGNWVTPLAINSQGELFAGYTKLYKLIGTSWALQQNATTNFGGDGIELVVVDPNNDNIMFVVNGSNLYKSVNKGVAFALAYTATSRITSVCVHSSDSNIVHLTRSGTDGDVLKSTNGGLAFTAFSDGLPALSKNVIRHQGRNSLNPLFLGTTLGVYYRDDTMSQWEPFDTNLPNVSVTDLEINIEESIIVAATYGRGVWQSAIVPFQTPANDLKFVSIINPSLNISCGGSISPVVSVKNEGLNTINNVNLTYDYNGTVQNYTWLGSIAVGATQNINIPNFSAPKGAYNLLITATIANDAFSDNNKSTTIFYVNNSGAVGVINTFENASQDLLSVSEGSLVGQWQRGINTNGVLATPGNNVYTTNFTGLYPDNAKSYLYSQCYNLTNAVNPIIKFKLAFDLEENYDLTFVEYSTNMGQTWNTLGVKAPNWYNSDRTSATTGIECGLCVGAQWSGTNTTLTEYSYPLNNLVGQAEVIFRIVFISDGGLGQLGVNIDDFVIEGALSNQEFELKNIAIYPNPSSRIFNISSGDKQIDKIEIYDVSGKNIKTINNFSNNNSENKLDINEVSNGIYFVKITSENQNTIKRIIKN